MKCCRFYFDIGISMYILQSAASRFIYAKPGELMALDLYIQLVYFNSGNIKR